MPARARALGPCLCGGIPQKGVLAAGSSFPGAAPTRSAGPGRTSGRVLTPSLLVSPPPQVSFSESGSLGNSSGSDATSLSSQLPDTPSSMVPSPVET